MRNPLDVPDDVSFVVLDEEQITRIIKNTLSTRSKPLTWPEAKAILSWVDANLVNGVLAEQIRDGTITADWREDEIIFSSTRGGSDATN